MLRKGIFLAASITLLANATSVAAQAPPVIGFSPDQADRGTAAFGQTCSNCHGEDMGGGAGAPGLTGPEFKFLWGGKSVSDLLAYVREKMPPGQASSLSDQQYLDIVTAILRTNGAKAGGAELTPKSGDLKMPVPVQ